jgi:hypothetical protein
MSLQQIEVPEEFRDRFLKLIVVNIVDISDLALATTDRNVVLCTDS